MKQWSYILTAICLLSCGQIEQPTDFQQELTVVEPDAGHEYGFEIRVPESLIQEGWKTYSHEHSPKLRDSFRTVHFDRRLTLVIERPDTMGNVGVVASPRGGYEIQQGAGDPKIILHVYEDLPRFSFDELVDTVRAVSHEVAEWDLNGTHVKELIPQTGRGNYNLGGFPHATTHVPRLIVRGNGLLFFFNYWVNHDIRSIETIVSTFRLY